jgi:hypothetical protein
MRRTTHVITTGVLVAALGLAPRLAAAQTGTSSTGSSTTGSSTAGSTTTPSGQTDSQSTTSTTPSTTTASQSSSSSQGGVDPAAARQHLANARQALADLTKLPAATQLQGDQRTAITNFIQAFNAFATAQNDWKSKFIVVDQQLDQILATASAGGPATEASTGATGTTGSSSTASAGAAAPAAGGYDPSIVEKLRQMRTELDAFLLATGDPEPHIKAIEKILAGNDAAAGSATAGTTGTTSAASTTSSSGVTLTADQVNQIRQHLEAMRQAANR